MTDLESVEPRTRVQKLRRRAIYEGQALSRELLEFQSSPALQETAEPTRSSKLLDVRGTAVSGLKNANGKFRVNVTPAKSSVVQVFDNTLGKKAFMRFDGPHTNTKIPVTTPHINTHPSIRNVIPDHTPISAAQLKGAEISAKAVNVVNRISKPLTVLAVAVDLYRLGSSAVEDYGKGSTRNTASTAATVAGGWGGGYGGAVGGAAIGSAFLPGLGTLVGAIVGGVTGGIGGCKAAEKIAEKVSDSVGYDVEMIICVFCKIEFECRVYLTGRVDCCPQCEEEKKDVQFVFINCRWCGKNEMKTGDENNNRHCDCLELGFKKLNGLEIPD